MGNSFQSSITVFASVSFKKVILDLIHRQFYFIDSVVSISSKKKSKTNYSNCGYNHSYN